MKKRKCKYCKEKFDVKSNNHWLCSLDCFIEYDKEVKAKKWKKEKAKRKKELMTLSDWLKIAQVTFNKYIRERDKNNLCISCQTIPKKKNAGHFRSVGGNPELRFEELNCHLQCEYCNTFKHGNLLEYRKHLINKIGLDKVEWLESNHEPKKYSINEVKELIEHYKQKIKELKK